MTSYDSYQREKQFYHINRNLATSGNGALSLLMLPEPFDHRQRIIKESVIKLLAFVHNLIHEQDKADFVAR
jgi:hypothetical protein